MVEIDLREGANPEVVRAVAAGEVDVAAYVAFPDVQDEGVNAIHWRSDHLVAVVSLQHPLAAGRFMAWFERLKAEGKAKAGQPLQNAGRVISKNGRTLSDGPYAESKEAIGGYFILNVADMGEAIEIAKQCPGLDIGLKVEVRPIAARCAIAERAEEALATANAMA